MQLRELKLLRNYSIKVKGKFFTARLDAIHVKNDKPAAIDFTILKTSKKVTLKTLSAIIKEVPFEITAGTLVRIVQGRHKDALARVYKVERVEKDQAFIVSGGTGKEIKVPLSHLRHADDTDPPRCFYPGCTKGVTNEYEGKPCCTTHYKANTEDMVPEWIEERNDGSIYDQSDKMVPKSRFDRFTARIQGVEIPAPVVYPEKKCEHCDVLRARIGELKTQREELEKEVEMLKGQLKAYSILADVPVIVEREVLPPHWRQKVIHPK